MLLNVLLDDPGLLRFGSTVDHQVVCVRFSFSFEALLAALRAALDRVRVHADLVAAQVRLLLELLAAVKAFESPRRRAGYARTENSY